MHPHRLALVGLAVIVALIVIGVILAVRWWRARR
jgi:hypothetical protein